MCIYINTEYWPEHSFNGMLVNLLGPIFSKWMGIFQHLLDCFQLENEHLFKICASSSSVVFVC